MRSFGADECELTLAEAVVDTDAGTRRVEGVVRVIVARGRPSCDLGDAIDVVGWLHAVRESTNPRPPRGRSRDPLAPVGEQSIVGTVHTESPALVQITRPSTERGVAARWWHRTRRFQLDARQFVASIVDRSMPSWTSLDARRLVRMMVLGRDDDGSRDLDRDFAEAGLAHLVAISGFNLAVLAGATAGVARLCRAPRAVAGTAIIAIVIAYALLVEPQAPIARAAIVASLSYAADFAGRRWIGDAVLAFAALAIVAVEPAEASAPGFQLTFASVLALRHLARPLHARWYGDAGDAPSSVFAAIVMSTRSLVSSSVAVWIATASIGLWHFGRVAIVGVPLSIIAIPLGTLMLVAVYAGTAIGLVVHAILTAAPSVADAAVAWSAMLPASIAAACAEALVRITRLAHVVPFGSVSLVSPDLWWTFLSIGLASCWCRAGTRRSATVALAGLVICWVPLAFATIAPPQRGRLEVRMLSVGDGSCYLITSGESAVVFDAGSSATRQVADAILRPALDEARVRRLDAVVISHPDLDHYSAVARLLGGWDVGTVIVSDRFLRAARSTSDAFSWASPRAVIAAAEARKIPVEVVHAGDERCFGHATWRWLNPPAVDRYRRDNDSSHVIRITCPTSVGESVVMLTGDVETDGIEQVLGADVDLRCDLLELPHHGSFRPAVGPLLEHASAGVLMQSTGPRRLRRDRLAEITASSMRCITARDGACRFAVDADGTWRAWRWASDAWLPRGRFDPSRRDRSPRKRAPAKFVTGPRWRLPRASRPRTISLGRHHDERVSHANRIRDRTALPFRHFDLHAARGQWHMQPGRRRPGVDRNSKRLTIAVSEHHFARGPPGIRRRRRDLGEEHAVGRGKVVVDRERTVQGHRRAVERPTTQSDFRRRYREPWRRSGGPHRRGSEFRQRKKSRRSGREAADRVDVDRRRLRGVAGSAHALNRNDVRDRRLLRHCVDDRPVGKPQSRGDRRDRHCDQRDRRDARKRNASFAARGRPRRRRLWPSVGAAGCRSSRGRTGWHRRTSGR
ncbi:MAG: ComEC/Rec2 family competence protein [Phycisphaerales bacterium]